jgi:hypothetical protein
MDLPTFHEEKKARVSQSLLKITQPFSNAVDKSYLLAEANTLEKSYILQEKECIHVIKILLFCKSNTLIEIKYSLSIQTCWGTKSK